MIKKKTFKDINIGDIFYMPSDNNPNLFVKCMKTKHFDDELIEAMQEKHEWVDCITNIVYLEKFDDDRTGILDYVADWIKVLVNEED